MSHPWLYDADNVQNKDGYCARFRCRKMTRKSRAKIGWAKSAKFAIFFCFALFAWEMAKTAAERVRIPQQPYKNTKTAPTTTHGRSNQQTSAEMTPLALSSVFCKFKVNLLEPRQLEPMATDRQVFIGRIFFLLCRRAQQVIAVANED